MNWVLGTLEPEEAARFAGHLEGCAGCRAEVARLQDVADALAEAPAPARPPPFLRDRLMAVAEDEAAISRALDAVDAPPPEAPMSARPRLRAGAIAAAVAIVAALGVGALVRSSPQDDRPAAQRTVAGVVTEDGGGPRARATILIRGTDAELVLADLEGPPPGRVYQAWVVRSPAAPIPTGALFSVPRTGDTRIRLPALRGAERVIVTVEPPRGSTVPSPPPVVVVRLGG